MGENEDALNNCGYKRRFSKVRSVEVPQNSTYDSTDVIIENKKHILEKLTVLIFILVVLLTGCTPNSEYKLTKEFYSKVAGVTFENDGGANRQELLPKLKEGERLELRLEPNNPHDKDAVEIYSSVGKIGYIGEELAPYISKLLNQGVRVDVIVSDITGGGLGQYYGCNIKISVYDKAD